jgi:hypothetical protein
VTSPTTTRAITEIPANTPRPIGRTESFFPGIVKLPDVVCSDAAAVPVLDVEGELAASLVPVTDVDDGGTTALGGGEGSAVGVTASGTVETPLIDTAGGAAAGTTAGTLGVTLTDDVDVVDVGTVVLVDDVVVALLDAPASPPKAPGTSIDSLQFLTSSTASFPFCSIIGVSVISHVSITGPKGESIAATVVKVVGPVILPSARRTKVLERLTMDAGAAVVAGMARRRTR